MQIAASIRSALAWGAVAFALLCAGPAAAALTCEQLLVVADTAVRLRDEGYSLKQVLAELQAVEKENKLTAAEMDTLRKSVAMVYMSSASPKEVALECVQAREAARR